MNSEKQSKPMASKENASRQTGVKNVTFKAAEKEGAISKSKPEVLFEMWLVRMCNRAFSVAHPNLWKSIPQKAWLAPTLPIFKQSPGDLVAGESSPSKLWSAKEPAQVVEDKNPAPAAAVSLRSLLTTQRLAREFKIRTNMKSKARCQSYHCMPITIENEQIPDSSAKPQEKFSCTQAQELIKEYLPARLAHVTYEAGNCASLTTALSDEIRHMVKKLTPPRYKLIVSVAIGSKNKEDTTDIIVTSQCLWDPHSDNFTSSRYINQSLFCVVLVHAVYFE